MESQKFAFYFRFACVLLTGALFMYCSWKYIQNHSTSLVEFQNYHEHDKDIYPSLTLCFVAFPNSVSFYDKYKLYKYYNIDNVTEYISFLKGDAWNDNMMKVNYDKVTIDLEEYIQQIDLRNSSGDPYHSPTLFTWQNNASSNTKFPFYISFRQPQTKCFSIDFSKVRMPEISGNTISYLDVKFRPKNMSNVDMMSYYIHYPNQFIRAPPLDIEYGKMPGILNGNEKMIWINSIDVIRRRNTIRTPCNPEWDRDDEFMARQVIKDVGCKPVHWVVDGSYHVCNSTSNMKRAIIYKMDVVELSVVKKILQPCDEVQAISSTSQSYEMNNSVWESKGPGFLLLFKISRYKEILHIRAFNVESLVGNVGGYVGLFLGLAFWQTPDAIIYFVQKIKNILQE